ncbi:MAG: hypothetical protein PHT69_01975 [Bacteroidales bacterium]|nr:hypothetical protein [Bacteroidales bacterium]
MTQAEILHEEQLKKQLAMNNSQKEIAMERKYQQSPYMNKPFDVDILIAAVNAIKKTNDYILGTGINKNQIDIINKKILELKNKGVTSIDGVLFLKIRTPKYNITKPGSLIGSIFETPVSANLAELWWVKNPCVKDYLSKMFQHPDKVKTFYNKFKEIESQNWDESNGLTGQVSNIAHTLYALKIWKADTLAKLKSFQNNANCPEVIPRPRLNRQNLQVQTATAGASFSNYAGVTEFIVDTPTSSYISYDITEDAVDYVFAEAQKEQDRRQVPTPQINVDNEAKLNKALAEKAALEQKLIEQAAQKAVAPNKFNMNYVYIGGGILLGLIALKFVFGSKGTKAIS